MRLFSINKNIAALRFEYSEVLSDNKILAMKLYGYRATSPDKFPESLVMRMKFYLHSGRE
jgi:hypothetical protein